MGNLKNNKSMVWYARKRNIFGLPWSFTEYACSKDRLFIRKGLFNCAEDEIRLYRILDIRYEAKFIQRIFKIGTVTIASADRMAGNFKIENIRNARDVKETISQLVEEQKRKNKVYSREVIDSDIDDDENM